MYLSMSNKVFYRSEETAVFPYNYLLIRPFADKSSEPVSVAYYSDCHAAHSASRSAHSHL
jgi:hypothetical protein